VCGGGGITLDGDAEERVSDKKVEDRFGEIWKMVRDKHLASSDFSEDECDCNNRAMFGRTVFAKHLTEHCRDVTLHEEVTKQCIHHVKVEVLRI